MVLPAAKRHGVISQEGRPHEREEADGVEDGGPAERAVDVGADGAGEQRPEGAAGARRAEEDRPVPRPEVATGDARHRRVVHTCVR